MYYEIYLDVLFYLNFWMNLLLLCLTALILKYKYSRFRMLLSAAVLAALNSAAICYIQFENGIGLLVLQMSFCLLGAVLAFPFEGIRRLFWQFFIMQMFSFLLGGILEWMLAVPFLGMQGTLGVVNTMVISGIAYRLIRYFLGRMKEKRRIAVQLYEVRLQLGEMTLCVKGLLDTGNSLREPVSGKPVSILDKESVKQLFLSSEGLLLIPYRAVGTANGILYGFFADSMELVYENERWEVLKPVIGIANETVSAGQEYKMLLSPLLFC